MTRLVVAVDDFVAAAHTVFDEVALPVSTAHDSLFGLLSGGAGMAGDDDGGRAWGALYDAAATSCGQALTGVVDASFRLASMFAGAARNYELADRASDAAVRGAEAQLTAMLPPTLSASPVGALPSAAGAAPGGPGSILPPGWSLVVEYLDNAWPDGDQDRLRATARVWRDCAADLTRAAEVVERQWLTFVDSALPEVDDIKVVCLGLAGHLRDLAAVQLDLARACDEFAHAVDAAHEQVISELAELVLWVSGLEIGGGLLAVATFGLSELAANALVVERACALARRVDAIIDAFVAGAAAIGADAVLAARTADRIAAEVVCLASGRVTTAVYRTVRQLPGIARELVSTNRLSAEARAYPPFQADARQLQQKFKHAVDFGVRGSWNKDSMVAFRDAVAQFLRRPDTVRLGPSHVTYRREPAILSYDPQSGLAVIQSVDGRLWSAWRMTRAQLYHVRTTGNLN